MAENFYDIIRRPIQTEKAVMLQDQGRYVFEVARDANKIQIKDAIQRAFPGTTVVSVHTSVCTARRAAAASMPATRRHGKRRL